MPIFKCNNYEIYRFISSEEDGYINISSISREVIGRYSKKYIRIVPEHSNQAMIRLIKGGYGLDNIDSINYYIYKPDEEYNPDIVSEENDYPGVYLSPLYMHDVVDYFTQHDCLNMAKISGFHTPDKSVEDHDPFRAELTKIIYNYDDVLIPSLKQNSKALESMYINLRKDIYGINIMTMNSAHCRLFEENKIIKPIVDNINNLKTIALLLNDVIGDNTKRSSE